MNVVVVDRRGSALWIAAKNRGNFDSYRVLAALDYSQPRFLIRAILKLNPDLVVFAWRGCLRDISNDYLSMKMLRAANDKISIGVTIPDHVDDSNSNLQEDFHPLKFSDYFLVSSKILFEIYQDSPFSARLAGILHDVPDYSYIGELNTNSRPIKSGKTIIWVGNSKWGKNHGYLDHKGLEHIMKPAFELVQQHDPEVTLIVIDSSIEYLDNHRVLELIQSADVLIQTSASEGTGLPIIEAAGLGTSVITTKVGIAPEILCGDLARQICERNPEELARRILLELPVEEERQSLLHDTYVNFIKICRTESIGPRKIISGDGLWRTHQGHRFFSIKWFIRHLRAIR
jgi:glycosyltransferase involved in cell wall biosynthesis